MSALSSENTPGFSGRRPELRALIDSLHGTPAAVLDRHLTVVFSNHVAKLLGPAFEEGQNLALFTFRASEAERASILDWDAKQSQIVAILRRSVRSYEQDGVFLDVIGQLATTSKEFSVVWADDPRMKISGVYSFVHEEYGAFDLVFHLFEIDDPRGDMLVLWHAEDERAVAILTQLRNS